MEIQIEPSNVSAGTGVTRIAADKIDDTFASSIGEPCTVMDGN